jgi:long-chain-fatty-acid--CoA ligase ACSBG
MSETSGAHVHHALHRYKLDTAGFNNPGCGTMIHNPDSKAIGEVCMRGRNVMMGYLENEKATMETIDSEGYLHSGDQGKIDSDGFLLITGRIKELIITAGGENVAPVMIEDKFKLECTPCSNIMVVGEN